jgi:hypothetical protein
MEFKMNKKLLRFFIIIITVTVFMSLGFKGNDGGKKLNKTQTNDQYKYIAINQIYMIFSNNGDASYNPVTASQGLFWPGGINATQGAVFEDGLIWGGKIGREIRVGGSTYNHGLQAGPILPDGNADDPLKEKNRIYDIRPDWESLPPGPVKDQYQKDYNEWPVDEGAPWVDVNGNGVYEPGIDHPQFLGDETLWFVSNDLDASRTVHLYGTAPMGLEMQCTVFAFNRTGPLGDMLFKKYKLINKGNNTIKDMTLGYWSDTDLGDANDDYTGCDTVLSLGYTYNGTNHDAVYGDAPPADGYDFFQGPIVPGAPTDSAKFLGSYRHGYKNLPMTAFTFYINTSPVYVDPPLSSADGSIQMYYYLTGYVWNGQPFIDPNTGQPVKFVLAGDPVNHTGWYEGGGWPGGPAPGDRRMLMASGPFTMAPGDTQEVVVGFVIARGADNISSVTALKQKDEAAQIAYNLDFQLTPTPSTPKLHILPGDGSITLWWEPNAESYLALDPLVPDTIFTNIGGINYTIPVPDRNFRFQGYRVWQFQDISGANPQVIATYDIKDGLGDIYNYQHYYLTINGLPITEDPVIAAPDEGLRRYITITQDKYSNGALYNANPYYFAVTAYGYSQYSLPPVLESPPSIQEILPGTLKIDESMRYQIGDKIPLNHINGKGDGEVYLKVVDPTSLTGHEYSVIFNGPPDTLSYTIIDNDSHDTLALNYNDFILDSLHKPIFDGFIVQINNIGKTKLDSLSGAPAYGVKDVLEVKGEGGTVLSTPLNVFGYNHYNSTRQWYITALPGNDIDTVQNLDWVNKVGYHDYELRFTSTGSQYYTTGYRASEGGSLNSDDPLGYDRVPFEIWDIGGIRNDTAQSRLYIKTYDDITRDTSWSQNPANGIWERIYSYAGTTPYQEPLSPMSGTINTNQQRFGRFTIVGDKPAQGTVIRVETWKPLAGGDAFTGIAIAPNMNDKVYAKQNINKISVFPNPYFGANNLETNKFQRFVRFTNLPTNVTIRIFSLAGVFIEKIQKNDNGQYLDWDLRNKDGLPVASGVYIAYLDMPGIGTKVMKLAIIMEQQILDRL